MAINLPNEIFQSWQNVTTFSSQAVNQVTETSQKAKESLTNYANTTAVNAISTKNQAVDILSQTTDKAKAALSETANQAVNRIMANTEQAKASLEASIKNAEGVSGKASEMLQNAISSLIGDWINQHPELIWLVSHPFYFFRAFVFSNFNTIGVAKSFREIF